MTKVTLCAALLALFALACDSPAPEAYKPQQSGPAAQSRYAVGCDLDFEGSDRKPVKLRDPRQPNCKSINGGRPISVAEWFTYVCAFDEDAPSRRNQVPQD